MNKKVFESKVKQLEEKIKQLEDTIKAKDKEIKMQSNKIREIMAINSPEKKMQKIKEQYYELRDLSMPNFGLLKNISVNDDNKIELEKMRQLKVRYGGINLNQDKSYLAYLPSLD